jgi:ABC-type uncharacterized transport system ATPase subunit
MLIGKGKLLYDGGLNELKKKYAPLRRVKEVTDNVLIDDEMVSAMYKEMEL